MVLSLTDHSAWASVRQARYNLRARLLRDATRELLPLMGSKWSVRPLKKLLRNILLVLKHSLFRYAFFFSLGTTSCFIRRVQSRHSEPVRLHDVRLEPSAIFELSMMSGLMMFTTLKRSFLACAEQHKPSSM